MCTQARSTPEPCTDGAIRGHPRGLYSLFFTEMWERMGYYGMRALLVLFMVDAPEAGGLGLRVENAAAIYGLFTAGVYLAALPGGWFGDRVIGGRCAVWCGGVLISLGYLSLAIPERAMFYPALGLVVLGTGLLKPNITAMVGGLYGSGSGRRDAGFTIFYMGINLGAAIGPLICSTVAKWYGWRSGFGAAGLGMLVGLIQYGLTNHLLGNVGRKTLDSVGGGVWWGWLSSGSTRAAVGSDCRVGRGWLRVVLLLLAVVAIAGVCYAVAGGAIRIDPVMAAGSAATVIIVIGALYFGCAFFVMGLTRAERRCVLAILVLFVASAVFWAGFEQAGSSFNLFAQKHTDRVLELSWMSGEARGAFEIPAGWFQSLGAIFVILFAPVVAWVWTALERRRIELDASVKFGWGLILLAAGFAVMSAASRYAAMGEPVSPLWLVLTYLLHSLGELCLSPVGLSSVTRLSPAKLVGQMVGVWFLATSLGNVLAGLIAGQLKVETAERMPQGYLAIGLTAFCAGFVLILMAKPLSRLSAKEAGVAASERW